MNESLEMQEEVVWSLFDLCCQEDRLLGFFALGTSKVVYFIHLGGLLELLQALHNRKTRRGILLPRRIILRVLRLGGLKRRGSAIFTHCPSTRAHNFRKRSIQFNLYAGIAVSESGRPNNKKSQKSWTFLSFFS
ncbi:unnamed protein product [Rodentolepis nana]|uniref:Uncharacterized protein n=1 Tax=Rodentolepis nana TaxID=102285 RepID=A0A0R3TBI9_RODNA|nr:unnamed protein product [Rodentolepis nana]